LFEDDRLAVAFGPAVSSNAVSSFGWTGAEKVDSRREDEEAEEEEMMIDVLGLNETCS